MASGEGRTPPALTLRMHINHRALHYLNLAYAKLLGYREPGGGFSYWGKGSPNTSGESGSCCDFVS